MPNHVQAFAATEDIRLVPTLSAPLDRLFAFRYTVRIGNTGNAPITIVRRHWEIQDQEQSGRRRQVVVDGLSIGGGTLRRLEPGETFTYTSLVPLQSARGRMRGHFAARLVGGRSFDLPVIPFELVAQRAAIAESADNRADPASFIQFLSERELGQICSIIGEYANGGQRVQNQRLFGASTLDSLSIANRLHFQRLILCRFLGEYEKLDKDRNKGSAINLSSIHSAIPDISLSDIYAVLSGQNDFDIFINHDSNVRFLKISHYDADDILGELRYNDNMPRDVFRDAPLQEALDLLERRWGIAALKVAVDQRASVGAGASDQGMNMPAQKKRGRPKGSDQEKTGAPILPVLPGHLTWPTERFGESPEAHTKDGIVRFVERVWQNLIAEGYAERRYASLCDPTVIWGITSYRRTGRSLPDHLTFLTVGEGKLVRARREADRLLRLKARPMLHATSL